MSSTNKVILKCPIYILLLLAGRTLKHHTYRSSYSVLSDCHHSLRRGLFKQHDRWQNAHERCVTTVGLSPDGDRVISGSMDCVAKVWDRSSGNWLQYLRGHSSAVNSVSLPTQNRAATGSRDGTARVWDIETGICLCTFTMEGGRQWVNALDAWGRSGGEQVRSDTFPRGRGGSGSETIHLACGSSIGRLDVFDSRSAQSPAMSLHDVGGGYAPLTCIYGVSVCNGMTLGASTAGGAM